MTQLTDAALAALATEQETATASARDRLHAVLADTSGAWAFLSSTTVRDTDAVSGLTVFGDGTVFLAVRGDDVRVVVPDKTLPGGWKDGPVVESLADLGRVLAAEGITATPAWVVGLAVKKDEVYAYKGSAYRALQAHTTAATTTPDTTAALWVKVP